MQNSKCDKCGSTNLKEGKVGYGYHAYIYENINSTIFKGGKRSKLLTTFCLDCGEVISFRVEKPSAFKK
ncbi:MULTISPECIES: hypothetical protein [Bacillus cereus group]|uniref:Transcription initiation factor TFIIIB n=2 Tax=Bacillus cereus group TaxID=86661 RepID=A0A1C4E9N3_BACTU|nr:MULTISPECIES: hypothetical protein [Bacillus cereus group]MED3025063.1 hypothetical protein [Bacillus wiedmannii]OTY00550.1 hypothetical protein BK729_09905 [Bacillus thuringiensis serovar wratislaviensis]OUB61894.1 hypothetical protein BK743_07135 [Bacillus thuringiensis serovar sylvestriensis]PRT33855.1 hypothetical protein C6357_31060 [Bacillus wiedmannii]TXR62603.1 hypothetical protein DM800_20190 [Bacillus sp. AY18-3]